MNDNSIIDDDILSVEVVPHTTWECPICFMKPPAAAYVPDCGHVICQDCTVRLPQNKCPQCRAHMHRVFVFRLRCSTARWRYMNAEVHLQFDEEEEPDATWTCNQCMNKRSKAFACSNQYCATDSLRCPDCWMRSEQKCTFCDVGHMVKDKPIYLNSPP